MLNSQDTRSVENDLAEITALALEIDMDCSDVLSNTCHYAVQTANGWAYVRWSDKGLQAVSGPCWDVSESALNDVVESQEPYPTLAALCTEAMGLAPGVYRIEPVELLGRSMYSVSRGRPEGTKGARR